MAKRTPAADAGFLPARHAATSTTHGVVLDARASRCCLARRLAGLALGLVVLLQVLSATPVLAKNHVFEKPVKVLGE